MVFPKAIGSKVLIAFVILCFFTEFGTPKTIRKVRSSIYVGREGLKEELTGHEPEETGEAGCVDQADPNLCERALSIFPRDNICEEEFMQQKCAKTCNLCEPKMPVQPVCIDLFEHMCPRFKRFCNRRTFGISKLCQKTCNSCYEEGEFRPHQGESHSVAII